MSTVLSLKMNSTKIHDSNAKRLESLREKANEFKNKKSIVRSSLNELDLNSSANKAKKIVFDSDLDEKSENEHYETAEKKQKLDVITQTQKQKNETKLSSISRKKSLLSSSESEPDSDTDYDENGANISNKKAKFSKEEEETIKMFESKINLDQKKANKLAHLKTKFSNDDNRFRIDDRFIESENDQESDNDSHVKATKDEQDLKVEHLNSLKILEEITGKQLIKPKSEQDEKKAKSAAIAKNKIVRYDPSKEDHKMYEINDEQNSCADDSAESSQNESENRPEKPVAAEDPKKYFQIEANLKDLFSSNDVFKFKFSNEIEDNHTKYLNDNLETTDLSEIRNQKLGFMDSISFSDSRSNKKDKYFDSSESEADESESENENESLSGNKSDLLELKQVNEAHKASKKSVVSAQSNSQTRAATFLPDFENDQVIKEALDFFHNRQSSEEIRDEWRKMRDSLVKEYKKKHKGVLRRQRVKENESILPWKKEHTKYKQKNNT